ncbi:MAG: hypothetical protein RL684_19 [Pseudomonadota bacterium]|jgi:hypothetical protein
MLRLADSDPAAIARLLLRYGLQLRTVAPGEPIPGSYWGESEAGLKGGTLLVRHDTPVHSLLHEAAHWICMSPERRSGLDTDAGGDHAEENAVCYLQIVLAGLVAGFGRERSMADMDEWGYTFRLGSARAWFEQDAADARQWLVAAGIIGADDAPTWCPRG